MSALLSFPSFAATDLVVAVLLALSVMLPASLLHEPFRRQAMAVLLALAAGVYLNNALGLLEFPFAVVVLACAYFGLNNYRFLGVGWILHTVWDIVHHNLDSPMLELFPSSSLQCAVTDLIWAAWFFMGAPPLFGLNRKAKLRAGSSESK